MFVAKNVFICKSFFVFFCKNVFGAKYDLYVFWVFWKKCFLGKNMILMFLRKNVFWEKHDFDVFWKKCFLLNIFCPV